MSLQQKVIFVTSCDDCPFANEEWYFCKLSDISLDIAFDRCPLMNIHKDIVDRTKHLNGRK